MKEFIKDSDGHRIHVNMISTKIEKIPEEHCGTPVYIQV
jgi:hypothetical protein